MTTAHAPTDVLADYAAGLLPPGLSLLVASHLTWCPCCRGKVARLEAVGGALLAEARPVPPDARCLKAALARIDAADRSEPCFDAHGWPLPRPLCRRLGAPLRELAFAPLAPGLAACRLDGFADESVALRRADPGTALRLPDDGPEGAAIVLCGEARAGTLTLAPGDCDFTPEPLEATGTDPCLCLVVAPLPA